MDRMPSPAKPPGRNTQDGAKPVFDVEAQSNVSTSGRHTNNLTYDGYIDNYQSAYDPVGDERAGMGGGMVVAFKVPSSCNLVLCIW